MCMYVCMHACMYVCMYLYMYVCMHIYMYMHACMHTWIYMSEPFSTCLYRILNSTEKHLSIWKPAQGKNLLILHWKNTHSCARIKATNMRIFSQFPPVLLSKYSSNQMMGVIWYLCWKILMLSCMCIEENMLPPTSVSARWKRERIIWGFLPMYSSVTWVYVCVYVCVHVCVYLFQLRERESALCETFFLCIPVWHECMFLRTCVCMYVCVCVYLFQLRERESVLCEAFFLCIPGWPQCMFVCVYVCMCVYARACVCMYVLCMYVCMNVSIHVCKYPCIYASMHECI
jgi:hypothetical protein